MKRKALACKDIEAERGRLDAGIRDVVSGALVLKGERDAMLDAVCRALAIEQSQHAYLRHLFDNFVSGFQIEAKREPWWKFWGKKA